MLLELFYMMGALLSEWYFITLILALGYIFWDQDKFALAILLYLLSVILNAYLKSIFRVPLNPEVFGDVKGWAFPSGHMQAAATACFYICFNYKNFKVLYTSILSLLIMGISIIHFGYHDIIEVLAGVTVAFLLVYTFMEMEKILVINAHNLGEVLTIIMFVLWLLVINKSEVNCAWTYSVIMGSLSFFISWRNSRYIKNFFARKDEFLMISNFIIMFGIGMVLLINISLLYKNIFMGLLLGFLVGGILSPLLSKFSRKFNINKQLEAHLLRRR